MEFILSLFYISMFVFVIYKSVFFKVEGLSRATISGIFLLKVASGILLWLLYTYYYTNRSESDIFKFYDDAAFMYAALPNNPWHYFQMICGMEGDHLQQYYTQMTHWIKPWEGARFHNNKIIIQFNALVYLFSFGYYNVHTVFMCFLSLVGLMGIYKVFVPFFRTKEMVVTIAVFLLPTVLFWSSGVLKEGLIMFGLGLLLYSFYTLLYHKRTLVYWVLLLFSSFVLFSAKMYVFAAFMPPLLSLLLVRMTGNNFVFIKFLIVHLLLFFAAINLYLIVDSWDVLFYIHQKQMGFIHTAIAGKAGSYFTINYLDDNVWSLIKNTPQAIFNALFRPHIFEAKSPLILFAAIENTGLLLLTIYTFKYFKKPDQNALPIWYMSIFFVFVLALLIGLVTPVLGSIVRYKLPLLPFYVLILLMATDMKWTTKRVDNTLLP